MIIDSIQPSVGDLVSVRAIPIDNNIEEPHFAFCVDVRSGNTAYQSADKLYYSRREGQSFAMDDKDIRLRMLSGDKPRIDVSLQHEFYRNVDEHDLVIAVKWKPMITNIGLKTIKRAIVKYTLSSDGLSQFGAESVKLLQSNFFTHFDQNESPHGGLMPTDTWSASGFSISRRDLDDCSREATIRADIEVLIDDGLPASRNFDVMADIRPLIESEWRVALS
jgi:hypothetical protein